jgi:hypothetical protein
LQYPTLPAEITRVVRTAVPVGVVLDGELVIWEPARQRTSFVLLQRRITAGVRVLQLARAHPAHYVVFDLLADQHGPLLVQPLSALPESRAWSPNVLMARINPEGEPGSSSGPSRPLRPLSAVSLAAPPTRKPCCSADSIAAAGCDLLTGLRDDTPIRC